MYYGKKAFIKVLMEIKTPSEILDNDQITKDIIKYNIAIILQI